MMTSPLLASIEVSISPRSQGWTALFVFSAVALGALEAAPGYKNSSKFQGKEQRRTGNSIHGSGVC